MNEEICGKEFRKYGSNYFFRLCADQIETSTSPHAGKPRAFELFKIGSFKFSPPLAKMVFKCPTLSSHFVCQMPFLKNNRRRYRKVKGYRFTIVITVDYSFITISHPLITASLEGKPSGKRGFLPLLTSLLLYFYSKHLECSVAIHLTNKEA